MKPGTDGRRLESHPPGDIMEPMPLKIAIFEPEAEGHHLVYVEHIVRALRERGHEVHLALTDRARGHRAFENFPAELREAITLWPMPDSETPADANDLRRIRDQFRRRKDYQTAFDAINQKVNVDACFMLNLDRADLPIALLGSPFGRVPFSGFLMGRQFHSAKVGIRAAPLRRRDKIAEPVFRRLLGVKTLRKVISVDETLVQYASQNGLAGGEKVVHVPDATYINPGAYDGDARAELGFAPEDFVLLLYGSLSLRKGVQEAIFGVADSAAKLLLAGKQDEEVRRFLQNDAAGRLRAEGRLMERDTFHDSAQEAMVFRACDAVWIGYRQWYGMSGVLLQAGALGKPVLAMDEGLVGHLTETHALGLTANIADPAAVAATLEKLASDRALAAKLGENGRRFSSGRTPAEFGLATALVIESTVTT